MNVTGVAKYSDFMRFRSVPKSVTLNMALNGVMALSLRYFTEFVYVVVVRQLSLSLPLVSKSTIDDHINTICAIIQRLFGQNTLITRCDVRRCTE